MNETPQEPTGRPDEAPVDDTRSTDPTTPTAPETARPAWPAPAPQRRTTRYVSSTENPARA
ncbi:hypothetical protein DZG02_04960 [Clavibacter lycopersici]|uniref:hypothetical protein n=1 Tax=Clavibacter lycopersici TaxID=2301718 RepID=UPI000E66CAE3|nr:hypothetical protein [Clavibacter lycopersici]RIJ61815.1 hypothetical protein DZG02_04960 [Clavibacter lycopersici]